MTGFVDPTRARRLIERDQKTARRFEHDRDRCPETIAHPNGGRWRCALALVHPGDHDVGGLTWPRESKPERKDPDASL